MRHFIVLKRNKNYKNFVHIPLIMDTTRHYKNQFEDYSIAVSHNIVGDDTVKNFVYIYFII